MTTLASAVHFLRGNRIGLAVRELHRSERKLGDALLNLADQQKVDHEVYYVARDIARWSREHVRRLAEIGPKYDVRLDPEPADESKLLARLKQKGAQLTGRFHEPGLLLLADLRHVHRLAAGVSLDWEVLAQSAQAIKDSELLNIAVECHPQTLRQLRWANAKVKESAAQIMVTG
jgi:hypothetical protein